MTLPHHCKHHCFFKCGPSSDGAKKTVLRGHSDYNTEGTTPYVGEAVRVVLEEVSRLLQPQPRPLALRFYFLRLPQLTSRYREQGAGQGCYPPHCPSRSPVLHHDIKTRGKDLTSPKTRC
ncbi:hypothetical protein Pcinc_011508 [Petrolisthes cinctipes]|uniref:Uncharacterized protein n=1 Tax=Petrolisthes cinctipes TaxID=88211 RepID=A0AAE1G0S3_PETCI|nr:hypothetical protein Pcinc_011508 [Petrolisthes cinctipes]